MKEGLFIRQNEQKWKEMELAIQGKDILPDLLAQYFIQLTDDLAYARTFYPKGESSQFLNHLTRLYHQQIYAHRQEERGRIWWFWQYELPVLFYTYRRIFLYAFLFFIFFLLVGIISAKYDSGFVNLILGDGYVHMTKDNIAHGNPFGVYQRESQGTMFWMIATNNIKVAFISYVSGILLGIGPIFFNMQNSIMLGAFEYYFFQHDVGLKSLTVIFLHGTIEIWSIIIAIGSGMILGNGLLFPGTYNRVQSLVRAGRDGLKIVVGLVPLFLIAAFIESYVTRYANMPLVIRLTIVGGSLLFLIFYFIVYPIIIQRKLKTERDAEISYFNKSSFQKWKIKFFNSEG